MREPASRKGRTKMFGRPLLVISPGTFLGLCIWLLGSAVAPALAMDCPVSGYDQVGERVTEAPSCDAAMQLLMACQMGSSADVAISLIVTKKCEGDFLASLERQRAPRLRAQGRRLRQRFRQRGRHALSIDQGDLRGPGGARLCVAGQGEEAIAAPRSARQRPLASRIAFGKWSMLLMCLMRLKRSEGVARSRYLRIVDRIRKI